MVDSDFGDFAAGVPDGGDIPDAQPIVPIVPIDDPAAAGGGGDSGAGNSEPTLRPMMPYTKWYRLNERYTLQDFWTEGVLLSGFVLLMLLYAWGSRLNKSRARAWFKAHSSALAAEFASVGFRPEVASAADPPVELVEADTMRQLSPFEYSSYATGRQNVAFVDVKLELMKRFNPINSAFEFIMATFFESFPMPRDVANVTLYPFDGREGQIVPQIPGTTELSKSADKSTFDGFVFAIVHKDRMKKLRDDRYDISITFTKDHPKLPIWLTTMSESAEITDSIMTDELVAAATKAGDYLDYVIISDQPIVQPTTIEECKTTKRMFLRYTLPSSEAEYEKLIPLFRIYLRLCDHLTKNANFRPQVKAKLKALRDHAVADLKKAADAEEAEERQLEKERLKKEKREKELSAMDAKAQKKYLEKEKDREMKKQMRKGTVRG